jgi:hypothetical protein
VKVLDEGDKLTFKASNMYLFRPLQRSPGIPQTDDSLQTVKSRFSAAFQHQKFSTA